MGSHTAVQAKHVSYWTPSQSPTVSEAKDLRRRPTSSTFPHQKVLNRVLNIYPHTHISVQLSPHQRSFFHSKRKPLQKQQLVKVMRKIEHGPPRFIVLSTKQHLCLCLREHPRRRDKKILKARGPRLLVKDCIF